MDDAEDPLAGLESVTAETMIEPDPELDSEVVIVATEAVVESLEATLAPSEPARPDPADESLMLLRRLETTLTGRLDALRGLFEREVRAEQAREKLVDRLHAELQEYKQDLVLSLLRPIFLDLIQLHDDIGKIVDSQRSGSDETATRLLGFMEGFRQGIEDILYRQGVEPFEVEGEAFDPRRQRAVSRVPTEEPSRSGTIAARHRKGFQSGTRIVRPEIVTVYTLSAPTSR